MKNLFIGCFVVSLILVGSIGLFTYAQQSTKSETEKQERKKEADEKTQTNKIHMKIGIVVYSNDPETVWNAFRFGNFAMKQGDSVKVFLLAKGVECESLDSDKFKIKEQMQSLADGGGRIYACGTCLNIRHSAGTKLCPLSTMKDLYEIVNESDKVVTF